LFYQNDYGKDYLKGLKDGSAEAASMIIVEEATKFAADHRFTIVRLSR
jgi:hypothetical protein